MKNNLATRIFTIGKAIFYALDWGWNPTHTQSAINSAELYLSQKTKFPQIEAMLAKNPKLAEQFNSSEFEQDISHDWDLKLFLKEYNSGSLGCEYAIFINKLGFEILNMNISESIPAKVRNILKLGIKNHDVIHFLFQLYDIDDQGNLAINDYHEWVFLFYALGSVSGSQKFLPNILLFPSLIKAFFSFRLSEYFKAKKIGTTMSSAKNLNLIWLKPYFAKTVEDVRQELGIQTLQQLQTHKP